MSFGRIVLDFETRSYADLGAVGVWNYALDPSTEVICACWMIIHNDGRRETGEWDMTMDPDMPGSLKWAILSGYEVEAHNYSFELAIWENVCRPRMGWCEIKPHQWRDTMASACYMAMPAKLDSLCRALRMGSKDPEGKRLITKYSCLYNKTAKADIPPEDLAKFVAYCRSDVELEAAVSDYLGELPDRELPIFQIDQRINLRGLFLDREGIEAAASIVDQRAADLTERFRELTGLNPTQRAKVIVWCEENGVVLDSMKKAYLEELLEDDGTLEGPAKLTPPVRQALQIRLQVNKASTKKLDAMARQCAPDGRARWQSRYHGAQTGRWTGSGFQPLNLVRSWEDVKPEQLVRDVMRRDAGWLDMLYGDAMEAVSKAGRHWIMAPEGRRILAGDFVSIEAVILACLAGEEWKVEAFRAGKKIYELMADKIYGLPEGTVTKKTHPAERQDGKTCLGASTQVLTQRGYVDIVSVTESDLLWDGVEWVTHSGLLGQGRKETIDWLGLEVTPDHMVLCRSYWGAAETVSSNALLTRLALETGSENLPSSASSLVQRGACSPYGSNAPAALGSISSVRAICAKAPLPGAPPALAASPQSGGKTSSNTPTCAQTTSTGGGYSIALRPLTHAANPAGTRTTGAEASSYMGHGLPAWRVEGRTWPILCRYRAGTTRLWKSTVSTITRVMSRAISGLLPAPQTTKTGGLSPTCSAGSRSLKPVYDIANAGPRRRFTVLTDAGPVIVHNCELAFGYQGALNAWLNFDSSGRHSDERIIEICKAWRAEHPMIVKFWRGLEDAAIEAVANPGTVTQYRDIGFEIVDEWLSMILPNGKRIWYREPELKTGMPKWHKPEVNEDCREGKCRCKPQAHLTYSAQKEGQWKRVTTYGGKLCENATQATAREFLIPSIVAAEAAGYPVILTVYDEIVAEVPNGHGSLEHFCKVLKDASGRDWAAGWPIGVDGWEGQRYRK